MLGLAIIFAEISVRQACFDWWTHEMVGIVDKV